MQNIVLHSKNRQQDVFNTYAKAFGKDFLKSHVIKGHYITNRMGVESVFNFLHGISDKSRKNLIH